MAAAVVGVVGLAFAVASTGIGLSIAERFAKTQGLQVLYNEKEADALVESVSPVQLDLIC
jgi:NAD(P)-dependent dehydrogenase (short-subunit alcohol dehydrogenase family)